MRAIQGGFGSAGAGSGALRRTATAVGIGSTAHVSQHQGPAARAIPRTDEPTDDEIRDAIRTQQCCWCLDNRTFSSISQHWTRAHVHHRRKGVTFQADPLDVRRLGNRRYLAGRDRYFLPYGFWRETGLDYKAPWIPDVMKVLLEPEPPEWEPLTPPGAEPPEDEHDPQMGLDL